MKNFNFSKKKSPSSQFGISPEEEFTNKAKANFLSAFDQRYGIEPTSHSFGLLFKISVTIFALLAIVAGASVYADTKNVGVDSSLYSFKRFGEKVQLVFTPAAEKPQLQASFATRRMDEIDAVKAQNPSSTILPQLNNDLNTAIDATVNEQAQIDGHQAAGGDSCGQFFSAIGSVSSLAHDALLKHPEIIQRFEQRCGQDAGAVVASSSSTSATSSLDSTSTVDESSLGATSTLIHNNPGSGEGKDKQKPLDKGKFHEGSASTSVSASGSLELDL